MKGLKIIKSGISLITDFGVSTIMKNIVLYTMPPETKLISKVGAMVAQGVLTWMVTDKTDEFIDEKVDEIANDISEIIQDVKDVKGV